MAPILIDSRGLIKLGFISVLSTAVVFVAGVFFGYQRAASYSLVDSERMPLPLPEKAAMLQVDIEPHNPALIEAGEDIDVDQPHDSMKTVIAEKDKAFHTELVKHAKKSLHATAWSIKNDDNISSDDAAGKKPSDKYLSASINEEQQQQLTTDKNIQPFIAKVFSSEDLSNIKYSIQVGMYGHRNNADAMMTQLQKKRLNAYVSAYTNKKSETRYNVRYGYFKDKKSAISALQDYKSVENVEAYLVRFSAENINRIAGAEELEPAAIIESTEDGLSPANLPVDILEEKLSQAEMLNTEKQQSGVVTN